MSAVEFLNEVKIEKCPDAENDAGKEITWKFSLGTRIWIWIVWVLWLLVNTFIPMPWE